LDGFVGVLSSASRAAAVEVLFDMVPTEAAYLHTTSITNKNDLGKTERNEPDSHRHRA
jgi:hypothetical protein